jgi:hypothetical protein
VLKEAIDKVKSMAKKKPSKEIKADTLYNYTEKSSREETVSYLLLYADGQRQPQVRKWRLYDGYYNNQHQTQNELMEYCQENNIPWVPAIIPDPYIHVESQVNADVPEFEFSGRDDDADSQKAKIRQYVVQYVLDNNEMDMKNNRNERRLGKLGNEIWKIGFNYNLDLPNNIHGDIFVHDIDPVNFINDPIALDLDDGEYHDYVYKLHRIKAARVFKKELDKLGIRIDEVGEGTFINTTLYTTETYDQNFDTVQAVEHWFRQPTEGSEKYTYTIDDKEVSEVVAWEAGDIACSIQINNTEIKYIPLYWLKTHKQNKMYPFAIGCKIPVENQFWDKSEIEPIKELVDAADRELATVLLNDTFMGNDIILMPENALADNTEIVNEPGAIWKTKSSVMPGAIQRLGGLGNGNNGLKDTLSLIREIIKQTVGNFDINMGGAPPTNVTTLGGLVQLKEQGNTRQNKKKVGVTAMWQRVFKLIDFTALEFFDDNRLIFLGAEGDQKPQEQQMDMMQEGQPNMDRSQGPVSFQFNSDNLKSVDNNGQDYYPIIDCTINVGDGIKNSPAMTIQATENIAKMPITQENVKIVESLIDQMGLPNRKEIKQALDEFFANQAKAAGEKKEIPKVSISYADIPLDAQIQVLAQMGIQSQGGLNPMQQAEVQEQDTQSQEHQQEIDYASLFDGLSHEEKLHLEANPQLLEEFIQSQGGAQ